MTGTGALDERYVILVVQRDGTTVVMDGKWIFREGDRIAVAIHVPEREEAIRALASRGWQPAAEGDGEEPGPSPSPKNADSSAEPSHD